MVLDQKSDKTKESIATNSGLVREGETSQWVVVLRSDLGLWLKKKKKKKLSERNTGNMEEGKSP